MLDTRKARRTLKDYFPTQIHHVNITGGINSMAPFTKFPMEREIVLSKGNTQIGVMPDICLVSHFQVDHWQVLYRAEETGNVKRWGLPLMIPNFSRLKDGLFNEKGTSLPPHGFGRILPWE